MIINVGSINIDHVYQVRNMPRSGETITASTYNRFLGGKGINQSIAIAKSGGQVLHMGAVGPDGDWARSEIERFGVETGRISTCAQPTGHAVICVDDAGENQIVIYSGANLEIDLDAVGHLFKTSEPEGNWALIQNETNATVEIARLAKSCGLKLAYSAAPFDAARIPEMVSLCDLLAVNEIEAAEVCNLLETDLAGLSVSAVLITKGSKGSEFHENGETICQDAFEVEAVDTTGAGDTFLGAFLACIDNGEARGDALRFASAASALQVGASGGSSSHSHAC